MFKIVYLGTLKEIDTIDAAALTPVRPASSQHRNRPDWHPRVDCGRRRPGPCVPRHPPAAPCGAVGGGFPAAGHDSGLIHAAAGDG